jgi:hypothetical protein
VAMLSAWLIAFFVVFRILEIFEGSGEFQASTVITLAVG